MNEKHYHATRHLRFAPIDTDKIPPNARYWQNSAQDQLCRLQELIGDEEALKMVIHIEGTWRAVYDAIKTLADLAEAQIQYASELAPVITFSEGEAQEVRPYHSNSVGDDPTF
jgi:hypothetical protein